MKRIVVSLALVVAFLLPSLVFAELIASKTAKKYHHAECARAKKITPENLVKFKTSEEAEKAGFAACKVCSSSASSQKSSVKQ